jgi:hypothetical protein
MWRRLIPFALVAAAIATIGGPAQAAPGASTYSATIDPAVVEAGASTQFTFTITKVSGGNTIGSFNIAVETGLTVTSAGTITPPSTGKDWSATLNGSTNTIEVRAAQTKSQPSLKNGESLSLTGLTATCAEPGTYTLDITATNSRTFSGGAIIEGNDPVVTCYDEVCTVGACDRTDPTTGLRVTTTVPGGRTFGINWLGAPPDACGVDGDSGITSVQIDPLGYTAGYRVTFDVPGANGSTDVCKEGAGGAFEVLSSCSQSGGDLPCIFAENPITGGRQFVVDFGLGDPNIDFG